MRKVTASDRFDAVAVMYSAFGGALRCTPAMMEIRAPLPDQANGL